MNPSSAADTEARPQSAATPHRQAKTSPLRRTSEIVLVAGTVIAVAAAFGPTWLVRVGVVVAVAAAVVACVFAWRELFFVRRKHAKDMLEASQQHGKVLHEERTRTGAVVDTLTKRVKDAGVVIDGQRVVIATLRTEISGLNGDRAYLRSEIEHRETVITSLRETVRSREAELIALHDEGGQGGEASVHHMPRRVLAEHESAWEDVPNADELWSDGSHPTVVDMKLIDTAMVLPNYEVDRLVG
ncbi:MAG TPA: hypothetical protein VIT20_03060 [Propionibacteriaceae bacterium]